MLGFRLAFSLLRIPRLFVSLLLFPLFLSVVLLVVQLLGSTILIRAVDSNPGQLKARLNALEDQSFLRQIIYGDPGKIKHLDVCRWQEVPMENGQLIEMPPSDTCKPDRLDVALHVAHPESYDSSHYEEILSGNFERLHICKSRCAPDVILNPEKNGGRADAYSIPTLLLLNRAFLDETVNNDFIKLANTRNKIMNLIGVQYLHAEGYDAPVQLTAVSLELAVLGSIASIIIVGLWLAIRAHRKVLDYFARSGALLPMVAALGKREFYAAIWLVTGLRVGAFLVASVPSTYILFQKLGEQEDWRGIFQQDLGHFLLWLFALIMSFTFAAKELVENSAVLLSALMPGEMLN